MSLFYRNRRSRAILFFDRGLLRFGTQWNAPTPASIPARCDRGPVAVRRRTICFRVIPHGLPQIARAWLKTAKGKIARRMPAGAGRREASWSACGLPPLWDVSSGRQGSAAQDFQAHSKKPRIPILLFRSNLTQCATANPAKAAASRRTPRRFATPHATQPAGAGCASLAADNGALHADGVRPCSRFGLRPVFSLSVSASFCVVCGQLPSATPPGSGALARLTGGVVAALLNPRLLSCIPAGMPGRRRPPSAFQSTRIRLSRFTSSRFTLALSPFVLSVTFVVQTSFPGLRPRRHEERAAAFGRFQPPPKIRPARFSGPLPESRIPILLFRINLTQCATAIPAKAAASRRTPRRFATHHATEDFAAGNRWLRSAATTPPATGFSAVSPGRAGGACRGSRG